MPSDACGLPRADVDRTGFALHKAKPKYAKIQDASTPLRFAQHDTGKQRTSTVMLSEAEASHTRIYT